jgi:hypothetical protein
MLFCCGGIQTQQLAQLKEHLPKIAVHVCFSFQIPGEDKIVQPIKEIEASTKKD